MIHPTHRREALRAAVPVAISFLALLGLWASPIPAGIKGWANYLPLHMALESASIFLAGLIFAITWHTPRTQTQLPNAIAGCVFAGVALLDFSHMLSYAGMPSFVTSSDTSKAIYFWLAARSLACAGLLTIALMPDHRHTTARQAWLALGAVLVLVAAVHGLVLFHSDVLPLVFIPGTGLTPLKIHLEYGLVSAYLLSALLLMPQWRRPRTNHVSGFIASALLMAMSEFMMTLYADVTDLYNLAGHVLKVTAYFYLYRPLFVELLQLPYERLRDALAELQATLKALPDLLFELDEDGRFIAAHTGQPDLLFLPPAEFLGKTMQETLPPPAATAGMQAIEEARINGVSRGKTYAIDLASDRRFFELSVAAKPRLDHEKARYIFIARDITERLRNERALEKEARFNAALIALVQAQESTPIQARLQQALDQVVALTESRLGFMAMVGTEDASVLEPVVLSTEKQTASSTRLAAWRLQEGDLWSKAVRGRRPVVFNDLHELPHPTGLPEQMAPVQRWIALPIFEGTKLVMLAGIGNKETVYTDADTEFLHMMAYNIWQILNKQETDKALRRFSLATSQSPNPVLITDLSARIEYVNDAFTAVTGYSAAEVMGKNPSMLQSGKTPKSLYRDMWNQLLSGQAWSGELVNRRKNGQEYDEKSLIYPIRDESGQITHYLDLKEDLSEKKSAAQRIQYLSDFDQLTGLPNRALLMEQLQFELSQARRDTVPLTVLWLNLDLFKDINDIYGHANGDKVLHEVALRMREVMQKQDIVARYAGDNFILVRPHADQLGAMRLVDQVLGALSRPITLQGEELVVTASMGLALYPNDGTTVTDLMRCAETAMHHVKQEQRNSFRFYAPDMQERTARALQLTNGLRLALARQELRLVYQPQVSLRDGQIKGAEALLRWRHPQLGDISPTEFIPLAENAGLSGQIGEWVLQSVLTDLQDWLHAGIPVVRMAVNLSAVQFSEAGLVENIRKQIEQSGVPAQWLELELTEATTMQRPEQATKIMSELASLGLALSIDDFGTGYSSLSRLKRFEVYKLKVDQSFIKDVVNDPGDQAIVTAIINMAHSLGISTLAEGVETPEQLAFLRSRQCDEIQGYLYSRPLEREAFEQLLRSPHRLALDA